jgi:LPS export ABC transporter protein LptC
MKRVVVFLCALALASCNPRSPGPEVTPSATASPPPTPPLNLKVTGHGTASQPLRFVQQTRDNRKQYELIAHSFESKGAEGSVVGRVADPHITFWSKDGTSLAAQAPTATIDQATGIVGLEGGVHARNSAGVTLQCDRLTYDHTTEMLHGEGHVIITNPDGFRATGSRFDSNVDLTNARMQ